MRFFLLFTILATVGTSAYASEPLQRQFNFKIQTGVAEVDHDGKGCLTIRNPTLKENDAIHLVSLQKPQTVITAKIRNKTSKSCSKNTAVPTDASFYYFQVNESGAQDIGIALALSDFNGSFKRIKGMVRADLNNDSQLEAFRECTSNEGLHLTIWNGEPLINKRLWHEYYYLGYDVQPNCTEKDYVQ